MSPLDVAKKQLLTAIRLFFDDEDPVSVHTLAGAASEIIEWVCISGGGVPFRDDCLAENSLALQSYYLARNHYRNAFKHAGRTPEEEAKHKSARETFSDDQNDSLLYICVEDYMRAEKAFPIEFQAMKIWYLSVNREKWNPELAETIKTEFFEGLEKLSRQDQKSEGRKLIHISRNDQHLLNHSTVEK